MRPVAQTLPEVLNQVLVQIEIREGKVYASPEEVTIYHVWDPDNATPGRAHEVRWMAKGHGPGQYVRIVPKGPDDGMFEGCMPPGPNEPRCFEIPPGYNSIASGRPMQRPSPPNDHYHWRYGIQLVEKGGGKPRVVAELDPDIIIKDDP